VKKILSAFAAGESGATAVEYGALVMFVSLALVLTLEAIGLNLANTFAQLKTIFAAAAAATPG
jgi:Flp pilus assembly pilin Flp